MSQKNVLLAVVVIVFIIFMFASIRANNYKDVFTSDGWMTIPDLDPTLFTGYWVYESTDKSTTEYLGIQYTGGGDDGNLLNIRRMKLFKRLLGPGRFGREEKVLIDPPLFRFIPITDTKIQILSINNTYIFEPTDIQYIETTNGPALLINNRRYYASGITF